MTSKTTASASLPARLARTSARWSASWASMATPPAFVTAAAAIPCGMSDVLFMQQINRKANHGALKNPLFRCVIVSVPAFCHWSERTSARTKLWCKLSGGLHHAEDSNCTGCILGDAERCRRCRPASQGAAASGASSGWQVAGRQGSDWQISTSSARRDQGLTVCVLDARKIERSGCAFHYHTYAPLRRGISFDWNREAFLLTGIAMWRRRAGHAVFGAFDPLNDWRSGHQGLWPLR